VEVHDPDDREEETQMRSIRRLWRYIVDRPLV